MPSGDETKVTTNSAELDSATGLLKPESQTPESHPTGFKQRFFAKKLLLLSLTIVVLLVIGAVAWLYKNSLEKNLGDGSSTDQSIITYVDNTPAQQLTVEVHSLAEEEKYDEAIAKIEAVLIKELSPEDKYSALTLLGDMQYRKQNFGGAITSLEAATKIKADYPWVFEIIGKSAESLGDKEKAINAYRKAAELYQSSEKDEAAFYADLYQKKINELEGGN